MTKVNHERGLSVPSDQALADRDRRAGLRPTTTTALLMGDPVAGAGRSALNDRLSKRSVQSARQSMNGFAMMPRRASR
jgi:hypothetical protein